MTVEATPIYETPATRYCTKDDLDMRFGSRNISTWADLDGDADSEKILNKISYAISTTYGFINSYLNKSKYAVPLETSEGEVPDVIRQLAVDMTGMWLWTNRGIVDQDEKSASVYFSLKKSIQRTLGSILRGRTEIDAVCKDGIDTDVDTPYVEASDTPSLEPETYIDET